MPCALFNKWLKLGLNACPIDPKNAPIKQLPRQLLPGARPKLEQTRLFIGIFDAFLN
jgi:hypothetical protein